MHKKFLTIEDIIEYYGVGEEVVNELVAAGDLKALPDRGVMKYRSDDLQALVRSGKLHPAKELPEVGDDILDSDVDFPADAAPSPAVDYLELDDAALVEAAPAAAPSAPAEQVLTRPPGVEASDSDVHLRDEEQTILNAGADEAAIQTEFAGDAVDAPADDAAATMVEMAADDSFFNAVEDADEGLTLAPADSGITLEAGDSGITLVTDSGLSLEGPPQPVSSGAVTEQLSVAEDDVFRFADDSAPAPVLAVGETDDEHIPGLFDEPEPTQVLNVGSDADAATLSGALEAGAAVEDIEVSDQLDDVLSDEVDANAGEEILEATDEVFGEEPGDEVIDEYVPAEKPKPREPTWGMLVNLSVIAAGVVVALNAWLVFEGLSTMWSGAEPSGAASSLISSLAGLM